MLELLQSHGVRVMLKARCSSVLSSLSTQYSIDRKPVLEGMAEIANGVEIDDDRTITLEVRRSALDKLQPKIIALSSLIAHLVNTAQDSDDRATEVAKRIGPVLRGLFNRGELKIGLDLEDTDVSVPWYRNIAR